MFVKLIIVIYIQKIICFDTLISRSQNIVRETFYKGESFPKKYLLFEDTPPSTSDLKYYIESLHKTVSYFHNEIRSNNDTEINRVAGMYFMKAIIKRTIRDHQDKLTESNYKILKDVVKKGDEFIDIYVYLVKRVYTDSDIENRVIRFLLDDTAQVHSIGGFSRGRMTKWIFSNIPMHSYVESMDNLTLAKDKYAFLTEAMNYFYISIHESDECLARVAYNAEPINLTDLRPCRPDPFCRNAILSSPSVSYALSHRLLNILLLRQNRRCYIQTEKEDDDLLETLCAFMYREAVYIARRGYFARDLFLEHGKKILALCGLLGYEEFFRHKWFRKAARWMDDQGCIIETSNFLINRTKFRIRLEKDIKRHPEMRTNLKLSLNNECHSHPMALLVIVLAHAIRHALNYIIH